MTISVGQSLAIIAVCVACTFLERALPFLLFGGRDSTAQIAKISFSIEGTVYALSLTEPKQHFLLCTEVAQHIEDHHIDLNKLHFYDESGTDITARYDLSGGGI